MNLKHFISELKRRNVFKVATAYAIVGWLIIQVVTAIEEPLSLPDWFDTATIILVFIGFPIALIIAWAFELTPEGLKKSTEVEITKSTTASTGKKLNSIIIGVLSIAVIFLLINRVFYAESTSNSDSASDIASIAVLPFVDMSPKGDQEYFSDGLAEELLNVLAKENNLKVAGRTSSFKFKGLNDDLKKMGSELGVDHILEGSVRKSGNQIRITAQLIKVEDGFHVWTETYDRVYSAENLFSIQDEISQNVLKELKGKLLGESFEIKALPTKSTEAYEQFLKGNLLVTNRNSKDIEEAVAHYKTATNLDPEFAEAYANLASAYSLLAEYGNIDTQLAANLMRKNADKALILDNSLGMAHAALSFYYEEKQEFDKQKTAIKKAYELEPNNSLITMWYANTISRNDDEALRLKLHLKAYELDPLHPVIISNVALDYMYLKDIDKAKDFAALNMEKNPEYTQTNRVLIQLLRGEPNGKLDEAFITAYKAHIKQPKAITILDMLSRTALDLNLVSISEEVESKLQILYPENFITINTRYRNHLYNKKFKEAYKVLGGFLDKQGVTKGNKYRLALELSTFDANEDYSAAVKYIEKYHPIYLTDTLTVEPYDNLYYLAAVSALYKKTKHDSVYNHLRNLHCNVVNSNSKFDGDITKESNQQLADMWFCVLLNNDAKQASIYWDEYFFNRKNKTELYTIVDIEIVASLIHDAPEYKAIRARSEADIQAMRNNAIAFLKDEGVWNVDIEE